MTFKRYHLEDGFTEAHYDLMFPDTEPAPKRQLACVGSTPNPKHDSQAVTRQPVPGPPPPTACQRTFNVPELAEEILLHLPPQNLLCQVQRVCRQWRRTVESSELIQQYLFFRPIPQSCELVEQRALISTSELEHTGGHGHEIEFFEPWASGVPILENPWLYLLSSDADQTKQLHCYPEASWRRMLLTQPPKEYETGRAWLLQDSALYKEQWCPNWDTWQPVLKFDTLRRAKKLRRQDEIFVEFDLAE
ncbi:unnamed protein product [Cercospora beticola]|nr:unnamed protein product [Cercospora beticola]